MAKAKCYKCSKVLTYQEYAGGPSTWTHYERDVDGTDVFMCGCIRGIKFKLDLVYYFKNRVKKNFVAKTVHGDTDYSKGIEKKSKKKINRSIFRKAKDLFGV